MMSGRQGRFGLTLVALVACGAVPPARLAAQAPAPRPSIGVHFGSTLSNFSDDPLDLARVGVQFLLPVVGPLSIYPMASVHLNRAEWQGSALARVDLTPSKASNPFYLGAGVSYLDWDGPTTRFYDVLFWGLKVAGGLYRPFVEMHFFDGLNRLSTGGGDFHVDLYLGVSRVLR